MTTVHHINAGWLHVPPGPRACCHCLLLEDRRGVALVDTGIGLLDVRDPEGRVGAEAIKAAGFQFDEAEAAARQIERLGLRPADVKHIVLTHGDPDHAGGVADFPDAEVHLSEEEWASIRSGNPRYSAAQFAHGPRVRTYGPSGRRWFGMEAREVACGLEAEVLLVPLFGHTLGHCGVAVGREGRWVLHVGDTYYLRVELERDDHPVSQLAAARADDDAARRASLERIRRLVREHGGEVEVTGYHDVAELPRGGSA